MNEDEDTELLREQIWDEITAPNMDIASVSDMLDELEQMGEDPFSIL